MPDNELTILNWSGGERANSLDRSNAQGHLQFEVGGISVHLSGVSPEDEPDSVLRLFCVTDGPYDIDVKLSWRRGLEANSAPPLFDSGSTWRLYECEEGLQFDFSALRLGRLPYKRLITDRYFRRASLQLSEESLAGFRSHFSLLEYPVDELLIMHRLTQEKAIELHGTGIVRANGEANLFVGHSGGGKSTTTRLWTAVEDVEVLSDDRIIVRRDASRVETPVGPSGAACEHRVLRLPDCSPLRNNLSAQDDKKGGMRMYGTPWHGEAMFASPNSAPLTRIFVLEHGHGNIITPLTPSQAVAELFARSFVPFHRHEYVDSALSFLEELANAVPVYRYAFEPDQRAVHKIRNFHD